MIKSANFGVFVPEKRRVTMRTLGLRELEVPILERLLEVPVERWEGHLEDLLTFRYLSTEIELPGLGTAHIELKDGGGSLHVRIGWEAEGVAWVGSLGYGVSKDQPATPLARELWTKVWQHRGEQHRRASAEMQGRLKEAFTKK